MAEIIRIGTHVRVFDNGSFIGCGTYMSTSPINIDVPNYPVASELEATAVEMDYGLTIYGEFEFEPAPRLLH